MKLTYTRIPSIVALALGLAVVGLEAAAQPAPGSQSQPSQMPQPGQGSGPQETQKAQPRPGSPSYGADVAHPSSKDSAAHSGQPTGAEGSGGFTDWAKGKQAADVIGKEVRNRVGEKLGEVEKVVRDKATNELQAVVGVGGFLGIGEKEVAIPLRDMRLQSGNLVVQSSSTADDLKQQSVFDGSTSTEVSDNEALLEAKATEGSAPVH